MQKIHILIILAILFVINRDSYADGLLSVKYIEQKPFSLSAETVSTWKKEGIRVFVAHKEAKVLQAPFQITADTIVCWFHEEEAIQSKEASVEVYCEGNVTILQDENYEKYEQVYLRFETMTGIVVNPYTQPIKTFEEAQKTEVVLRGEEIRSRKEEEYLSHEIPKKVLTSDTPEKQEIVDIIADNIDSWQEEDKRIVVALGNVKINKKDAAIDADNVILWFDQKKSEDSEYSELPLSAIYAEGNVMMRRKDDMLIADKIFENIEEDKGILINSQIKTTLQPQKQGTIRDESQKGKSEYLEGLPVYVSGEQIKHVDKGQYEIKNGIITTCGYGHPHYHFKGKKIRLIQRGKHNIISSTNNTFHVGSYPMGYLPYLSLDVRKKEKILRNWEFGSSSRFGSFLSTDWDLFAITGGSQKDWSDLIFSLDYLQERGLGTGINFEYRGQDAYGFLDTYYIKDKGEFDINDIPIEDEDRGAVLWRHRQELPYDFRLDMEYSYLSDPRFLREFFRHEFKQEKDRETVLYLRRIHDTTAQTFLINEQLNGFDTTVDSLREKRYAERLPELTYQIIGEPIWDNRLIFTSESSATHFDNSLDRIDEPVQPQSVVRLDNVNRITMPWKPGFFNINPFVEGRVTGYSESIDTSGPNDEPNGPATGRFIGSLGFDWSSTHWRTYSVYNDFLKINRLRHIFVPELRYVYNPVVTEDPNTFYQYDEIDAQDSSQIVVIGVKNMLQTKRGEPGFEKNVDFVYFNLEYYIFPTDAGIFNDGINGIVIREDNFVNLDFRCKLTDIVTFVSERNEFNTEEFRFDVLSSGFEIYNPPKWQYFVGHRFIRDISSTLILAADYRISEKWSVAAREMYDFKSLDTDDIDDDGESDPKNLRTNFILSRYFHDWVASLTLELDPVRNDSSYRFDISPKGLQRTRNRFWF
ncbi:MAG: LPS assembly protein LptD [Candidatus Jettenia sp.]|nr:MAG: LPS assembly protein LptD [Candidatus Jettenia sp.]